MRTAIVDIQSGAAIESLRSAVNLNFREIKKVEQFILLVNIVGVDASAAPVTFSLPAGSSTSVCYLIRKTDASANAVTVAPLGTDTVEGAASYSLPNQYDKVLLQYDAGVWYRLSQ
jgi:hypothetical protein